MPSFSSALNSEVAYQRVNSVEEIPLENYHRSFNENQRLRKQNSLKKTHYTFNRVLLLINTAFLVLNAFLAWNSLQHPLVRSGIPETLTYSPATVAISYEPVVFSSAFGIQRSPFQGEPSDANNKLWEDLYDFGITRLTADEARPMANKTLPIPSDEGGYVVQLAVFHQLHCLNLIRHGIYGAVDMENQDELLGIEHLDHCIDMIRQSIMCSSDVTPLTFSRESRTEPMKAVAEVVHTCRDFVKLQLWALERRVARDFDKYEIVADDPLGWGSYEYSP